MGITERDLISFTEDIYNRKTIAENLTKIIDSQNESMVISLDSEWGTGKTTFITMWKDLLDTDPIYNTKYKTLSFNAWENDYIKDPLLALFSEMESQIKEEDTGLKKNLDSIKSTLGAMSKVVAVAGIKIATRGALDIEKIKLGEDNEKQLIDLAGKLGELSIKEISASKNIRTKFKEEMSKYQIESGKKIIFFIDELDRCRPTFAIELLEVIKHLFNIDNFIFLISIDKEQLAHSVSTIYGQNMDTIGYLRRFFDLDYKLPKIDVKKYIDSKNTSILSSYQNIQLFEFFIKEQFEREKLSLRDVDKAYYYIKLLLPLIKEFNEEGENWNGVNIATISYLYSILITLKIKKPVVYKNIINGNYKNPEEILGAASIVSFFEGDEIIGYYHPKSLSEITRPLLSLYLELNLKSNNINKMDRADIEMYTVGIKDGKNYFDSDDRFSLVELFKNNEKNINNKLEFVNSFSN